MATHRIMMTHRYHRAASLKPGPKGQMATELMLLAFMKKRGLSGHGFKIIYYDQVAKFERPGSIELTGQSTKSGLGGVTFRVNLGTLAASCLAICIQYPQELASQHNITRGARTDRNWHISALYEKLSSGEPLESYPDLIRQYEAELASGKGAETPRRPRSRLGRQGDVTPRGVTVASKEAASPGGTSKDSPLSEVSSAATTFDFGPLSRQLTAAIAWVEREQKRLSGLADAEALPADLAAELTRLRFALSGLDGSGLAGDVLKASKKPIEDALSAAEARVAEFRGGIAARHEADLERLGDRLETFEQALEACREPSDKPGR